MTPEQRELIFGLALVPGRGRAVSPQEFLDRTGIEEPREWALHELEDAIRRHDSDDAEAALLVSAVFGRDHRWAPSYQTLLETDWHVLHEGAAQAVGHVGDAVAVPALVRATQEVPEYLEFDEARTLASKAIHSLGTIPGPEAEAALVELLDHEDHVLAATAGRVLERRRADPPSPNRPRVIQASGT